MKITRLLTLMGILPLILLSSCRELPTEELIPIQTTSAPTITPTTLPPTAEIEAAAPLLPTSADVPLSEQGPWFVFSTPEGLFACNPDGTGLTQFYFENIAPPYTNKILTAPKGGYLAYLTGKGFSNTTLRINLFPWRTLITNTPLTSEETEPGPEAMPGDPVIEAWRAMVEMESMAFSPDGSKLAFMAAIEGNTSDLYLYSLDTYQITQLTDGPSQGYQPIWSPDGEYIVHTGASTFGTGAGYALDGVWAAPADSSDVVALYDPADSSAEEFIGWVDERTFVVHSWDPVCGSHNLRTFSINTKESRDLWTGYFHTVAFDPVSKTAVLAVSPAQARCSPDNEAGIYLVPTDGNSPMEIVEDETNKILWAAEAELFFASSEFGTLAIDSKGQFLDLDKPQGADAFPAAAPGSRDLAWTGPSLWIGPLLGSLDHPPRMIFDEPVYSATWDPGDQGLLFYADSGLYAAKRPDFTPELIAAGFDNRNQFSGWVIP